MNNAAVMQQALEIIEGDLLRLGGSFAGMSAIAALRAQLSEPATRQLCPHGRIQGRRCTHCPNESAMPIEPAQPRMMDASDEAYAQTVIDALYENSDPVSVEAAELLTQMLAASRAAPPVSEPVAQNPKFTMDEWHTHARKYRLRFDIEPLADGVAAATPTPPQAAERVDAERLDSLTDLLESARGYVHGGPCGEGDHVANALASRIDAAIDAARAGASK